MGLCRDMFNRRREFDGLVPGRDPDAFVSEYAVTEDAGLGNLRVGNPLPGGNS